MKYRSKPKKKSRNKVVVIRKRRAIPKLTPEQIKKKIRDRIQEELPMRPYKIGIAQDLYKLLEREFPGRKTLLRKTIKHRLYWVCRRKGYLNALIKGKFRYGIKNRKETIRRNHREKAKLNLEQKRKSA